MTDLRTFYLASLPEQIDALETALAALEDGDLAARESLIRVAHQLKGSGASYGFDDITAKGRKVLDASDEDLATATSDLISLLRDLLASAPVETQLVLVVEDDPMIEKLLVHALETPDREIVVAPTVAEACVWLEKGPNLVILDLFLPDGDGRNVLTHLREEPGTSATPVIVISGSDSEVVRLECLALGAEAFISKPIDPAAVGGLVDSLLRMGSARQVAGRPAESVDIVPDRPMRILLAEDDDMVATLVVDRLSRDGFELTRCADGASALREAEANPPDLTILDVKMPKMGGFELLSRLRQLPDTADMPVIVLTAMGSEAEVTRGFQLGASDYVLKPFSPVELSARVSRLVGTR